eukprot:15122549-Heterocapsa_arctica.AAC.1
MNLLPAPIFVPTCMCQPIPVYAAVQEDATYATAALCKVTYSLRGRADSIHLVLDSQYMSGRSSSPNYLSRLVHVVAGSLDMLV